MEKVEEAAKKAMTSVRRRSNFVVPGTVFDYTPDWMLQPPKTMNEVTSHAQWVAMYWSRAMTQLAAQATTGKETFQIKDILEEFLNINQMCVENSGRMGWTYDQELWSSLESRLRKGETDMDLKAELRKTFEGKKMSLRDRVEKAKAKAEKAKTEEKAAKTAAFRQTRQLNTPQ